MTFRGSRGESPNTLEIFGVRVVLYTCLDDVVSAVVARLPRSQPSPTASRDARRYVVRVAEPPGVGLVVHRGLRKPVIAPSAEAAADLIVDDLQRALAHRAEGLVFVHAGVVAWQGRALVLPGRSGSGKSQLVAALARAGADYLSDEFAVFDRDGLVQPYARSMALRQSDGTRVWMPAQTLGARTRARPAPPALIAFLRYSAGSRWRPRRLSPGQTLLGLLRHAVAARRRLALVRSVLRSVALAIPAISAVRDEADELAERLLRELASARPFDAVPLEAGPAR